MSISLFKQFFSVLLLCVLPHGWAENQFSDLIQNGQRRQLEEFPEALQRLESISEKVRTAFFDEIIRQDGEVEFVYHLWMENIVFHATAHRFPEKAMIQFVIEPKYHEKIHNDLAALIICHEMGHLYGGPPYFTEDDSKRLSAEGQADYFTTRECLPRVLPQINSNRPENFLGYDVSDFIRNSCKTQTDPETCERALVAGQDFVVLSSNQRRSIHHQYLPRDDSTSHKLIRNIHPPYRCRLETFLRGLFNIERPECWFGRPTLQAWESAP